MSDNRILAGRYELLEKIGDGGMAVVYKAKDRLLKRYIAVKILKMEFVEDVKFIENFRRESHAAASLSHPNIVSIYDVGQEGKVNYIVMELVTGTTLSDMIRQEAPFEYRKAVEITRQIANGLAAAHKKGIIHRDVKPHNILITEDGIAKITDFGIAKAVTNTTIVDSSKENIMGSVHYFSPEQAKGQNVDAKSDIYSLGIVLFEMLTGKVPFDGDNPVTVALMQINEKIISPSVINHSIPPGLEKIVLKATEKNPRDRYKSAEEMIEALDDMETVSRVVGESIYAASDDYQMSDYTADYGNYRSYTGDYSEDYMSGYKNRDEREHSPGERSGKKKRKKNKKLPIIIGLAAILVIGVTITLATGIFKDKNIEVPDFLGMTLEQAEEEADKIGLKIEVDSYEFSKEYDIDQIMSQDPEEGTMVAEGDTITVNISKGGEKGAVPNVVGKSEEDAKKMIEDYGYEVGTVKEKESSEEEGTVIEQDPAAGSEVSQGSAINLVISDGSAKEMNEVPDLLGMSEAAARKAIENAGFTVGTVTEAVSSTYGEGEVMWQEYNKGTKLEKGESISIRISRGKTSKIEVTVPFTEAKNEIFYMTVTVTDENGTKISPKQECHKSDGTKVIYIEGTGKGNLRVYFDDVEVMNLNVDFQSGTVGE